MDVLFVCTGNICRSASAEVLLRAELDTRHIQDITVRSSGLEATAGDAMDARSATLLNDIGIDTSLFHATAFRAEQAMRSDVTLVFSRHQLKKVTRMAPQALARTLLLTDLANACLLAMRDDELSAQLSELEASARIPALVERMPLLRPQLPMPAEIADPFQGSDALYRRAFADIALAVHRISGLLALPAAQAALNDAPSPLSR